MRGRSPRREALEADPPWMLQETLCAKGGYLAPLTQTQMAPIIWGIIIGLVAMFLTKVHPAWHRVHCSTGLPLLPCANLSAAARLHS